MTSILITGGTGTLGRLVTPLLLESTHSIRLLSRKPQTATGGIDHVTGDLATGAGIDSAVAGVDTIVHCAGSAKGDDDKTRNLVRAAVRAGRPHIVYISVVGCDRVPVVSRTDRAMFGYLAAKRAAEVLIEQSGLTYTTLRASQFYDSLLAVLSAMARMPVIPVPKGFKFQPIDTAEVATRLVELSLGRPVGLVPEMAGPRAYTLNELVRSYLAASHRRRLVMAVPMAGRAAAAIRAGANLAPDHAVGKRTWEDFLAKGAAHNLDR